MIPTLQKQYAPNLGTSSSSRGETSRHLTNLDLMRTAAVGLVFAGHLMETAKVRAMGDLAHFGVLLFFIHTAFVLMISMDSMVLRGRKLYGAFLIRRFFRIYPLSVIAVVSVIAFAIPSTAWLGGYSWVGWRALLSNIFLTQNITQSHSVICVLWSLPFEVQMYTVLPAIYLFISRSGSSATVWQVWLFSLVVASSEYFIRNGKCDPEFLLTRYFPCFVAGVLAWQLANTVTVRLPGWMWVMFIAGLISAYRIVDAFRVYGPALLSAFDGSFRSDHVVWWPPAFDLMNDWLFCAVTGFALPHFVGVMSPWLKVICKRIAQYSYGIYLSHVPILWLCFKRFHLGSLQMSVIVSLSLTAIISIFSYHLLEDPAIRLGKRLAARCAGSSTLV